MRLLALIRHGSYDYGARGVRDADRPLDDAGRAGVDEVARELAYGGFEPDHVVSGAAARTHETARRLAAALSFAEDGIEVREDLYHASREQLLALVRGFSDAWLQVALVGHHPGLTELCALLTDRRVEAIPFAGVAWMEVQVDAWSEVGHSSALNVQRLEPAV